MDTWDLILAWGAHLPEFWTPPVGRLVVVDPDHEASSRATDWLTELLPSETLRAFQEAENRFLARRDQSEIRKAWNLGPQRWTFEAVRPLCQADWEAWWTPGNRGGLADFLLEQNASWAEEFPRLRQAWPGPQVVWRKAWTVWSRPMTEN
jgi:hypothetical protein